MEDRRIREAFLRGGLRRKPHHAEASCRMPYTSPLVVEIVVPPTEDRILALLPRPVDIRGALPGSRPPTPALKYVDYEGSKFVFCSPSRT